MRLTRTLLLWVLSTSVAACSTEVPSSIHEAEGGAGGSRLVGTGGAGGEGGTSGQGGRGGNGVGGRGGDPGGTGGDPAAELGIPGTWTFVDLETQPIGYRLYEGDPSTFAFPAPEWEPCGEGCESSTLLVGDRSAGVIVSTLRDGPDGETVALAGVRHVYVGKQSAVRRVLRLKDGSTVGAYIGTGYGPDARYPGIGERIETALSDIVTDVEKSLFASCGLDGRWVFREPWDLNGYRALNCEHFDLESSPPAYLFACPRGLEIMRDTAEVMVIPDSQNSVTGAGSHGLAVWAEHPPGERVSRIRSWAPGEDVRTLAHVPGDVCQLAVGRDRIVGFKGAEPAGSPYCIGALKDTRLFWLPRDGGDAIEGPLFPYERLSAWSMSTAGDFAAVTLNVSSGTEKSILLVRLSDWKMRRFPTPQGRSISTSAVAVDDEHLYFAVNYSMTGNHGFDRLYRYRLDHFDQIGEPFEIEGGEGAAAKD